MQKPNSVIYCPVKKEGKWSTCCNLMPREPRTERNGNRQNERLHLVELNHANEDGLGGLEEKGK